MTILKSPYPYFGGKLPIAAEIWRRFGDVDNYVEPFFGSLAVLLARPKYHGQTETVNEKNGYLVNFWRAIADAPDEVAKWADYPNSEWDLTARHMWLVGEGRERIKKCEADPFYYDAQAAGWWVWGAALWIGSGWCTGNGPWIVDKKTGVLMKKEGEGQGVKRQIINLSNPGEGINRKRIHLGRKKGINRKQNTDLATGEGILPVNEGLFDYFRQLSRRVRRVSIVNGDWSRVITHGALAHGDKVGVFLDPPYSLEMRSDGLYAHDHKDLPGDVRAWCIKNGGNKRYRIALCGLEGEHNELESLGWIKWVWKAHGAYQSHNADGRNQENRRLERVWFSPACINQPQMW